MREDRKYEFVYMERHHIILRSKGGSNEKENLIWLLGQEHYYAHKVLHYENRSDTDYAYAWWAMSGRMKANERRIVLMAEEYAEVKKVWSRFRRGYSHPNSREIVCLETGEEFANATEAAKKFGCKRSVIHMVCNENEPNQTAMGFHFVYKDDYSEEKKTFLLEQKYGLDKIRQEVVCVETGEIFKSIIEAARFAKRNESNIRAVLSGRIETSGKDKNGNRYHWKYLDESKNNKLRKCNKPYQVKCLDTGEIFNSVSEVVQKYKMSENTLRGHLNHHQKTCGLGIDKTKRYQFEYIKEGEQNG